MYFNSANIYFCYKLHVHCIWAYCLIPAPLSFFAYPDPRLSQGSKKSCFFSVLLSPICQDGRTPSFLECPAALDFSFLEVFYCCFTPHICSVLALNRLYGFHLCIVQNNTVKKHLLQGETDAWSLPVETDFQLPWKAEVSVGFPDLPIQ